MYFIVSLKSVFAGAATSFKCVLVCLLFFFIFLSLFQKIISSNIKNHVSTPLFSELEVLQFLMNYAVSISAVI